MANLHYNCDDVELELPRFVTRSCQQYSSPNIIRMMKPGRMRWAGHVARIGEKRNVYRILLGKPEGKRPLGRPRCDFSRSSVKLVNLAVP
jgi:hypothetical protein